MRRCRVWLRATNEPGVYAVVTHVLFRRGSWGSLARKRLVGPCSGFRSILLGKVPCSLSFGGSVSNEGERDADWVSELSDAYWPCRPLWGLIYYAGASALVCEGVSNYREGIVKEDKRRLSCLGG